MTDARATPRSAAAVAYQALAPRYDEMKEGDDYDRVAELLLDWLGHPDVEVLDAATGTGNLAVALSKRGAQVDGFDISPAMLEVARAKPALANSTLWVDDLRTVAPVRRYDVVTCWDDSMNYLVGDGELVEATTHLRDALEADGVLVFDLNTLRAYEDLLTHGDEAATDFTLSPHYSSTTSGATHQFSVLFPATAGAMRASSVHEQRHFDFETVKTALLNAGFQDVAAFGLTRGGLVPTDSEDEFHKLVWTSRRH